MSTVAADHPQLAFLGGGNMATALIGGLLKTGWTASAIRVAEPVAERAQWLRDTFGIAVCGTGADLPGEVDALVLAVKPQQLASAVAGLTIRPGALVLSIAAGVRLATLQKLLGDGPAYVRSMPNTPALLGAGISGLFAQPGTSASARSLAEKLLAAAGECVWVESEAQLDAVTALSGSGPAYFFLLVEALQQAGAALGLEPGVAAKLAAQTCVGAARMVGESGLDAATLRANVTSKGGTTEAAVQHLERSGLRTMFQDALAAADARAKALGDALDTAST